MTWASELAQTLQEPTEMTRKWKATLSFLYILIWQFLEGPRTQDKCQEQASSVSSFNGSVSNTAASARGLVYMWESGVSATNHKDVATQSWLPFSSQIPSLAAAAVKCSWQDVLSPRGGHPGTRLTAGRTPRCWDRGGSSPLSSTSRPSRLPPSTSSSRRNSDSKNGDEVDLLQLWLQSVNAPQRGHRCPHWVQQPCSLKCLGARPRHRVAPEHCVDAVHPSSSLYMALCTTYLWQPWSLFLPNQQYFIYSLRSVVPSTTVTGGFEVLWWGAKIMHWFN